LQSQARCNRFRRRAEQTQFFPDISDLSVDAAFLAATRIEFGAKRGRSEKWSPKSPLKNIGDLQGAEVPKI
jgi:hypothetical protein